MIYDYTCTSCGNVQEESCSVNEFKEFSPPCEKCGAPCKYTFCATKVHFILKDGPSGSWPSKGDRVKRQRTEASNKAARRQKERYKVPKLIPNVEGRECESWAEAKNDVLYEHGPKAAATYDSRVKAEKKK